MYVLLFNMLNFNNKITTTIVSIESFMSMETYV